MTWCTLNGLRLNCQAAPEQEGNAIDERIDASVHAVMASQGKKSCKNSGRLFSHDGGVNIWLEIAAGRLRVFLPDFRVARRLPSHVYSY